MINNLPKVQGEYLFDEPLAKYTWFGTGGNADVLFKPKTLEDLVYFLKNKPKDVPVFVLGAGSNILIRDKGIRGITIVLKDTLNKISLNKEQNIQAECGASNSNFFKFCKEHSIGGYEFLGTIPGLIGGGIRMNAGCYGSEIKDKLISVDTVTLDGVAKTYTGEECKFEYRKNNLPQNLIFVSATFDGSEKSDKEKIESSFQDKLDKRRATQPIGVRTCGCAFKNPENVPAWKLIQEAGMQGVEIHGAKMSEKHANFMVNTGVATSADLENLGEAVRKKVLETSGINLEWEIEIVGEK